ncbi:hypothetical protein ACOSZF_08150 [Cytobacillus firmus]|jgi:hypothetical protein|uniref:Uncharacterized protein n=1 Tax=Cytobacillus firmus TaxID=1399 RepID=A0A380XJQ0_CYTFI|nr:hypothetical protein [Cytobacillus firmus]KAF0824343.1 hypothetical protein KIS1582_1859 [Cytobacillus firmus]MDD9312993.1 hypothetical protein [Cytobacillus firmus]MEC1891787.1 hypothetical protein [Cytobacillus firmus]MED1907019.1 hypothetical protein [Cytobacillus firmus]MED1939459.1 hypothetical protein [Cytobacillus firmus]
MDYLLTILLFFTVLLLLADLINTKKEVIRIRKTLEEMKEILKDNRDLKK